MKYYLIGLRALSLFHQELEQREREGQLDEGFLAEVNAQLRQVCNFKHFFFPKCIINFKFFLSSFSISSLCNISSFFFRQRKMVINLDWKLCCRKYYKFMLRKCYLNVAMLIEVLMLMFSSQMESKCHLKTSRNFGPALAFIYLFFNTLSYCFCNFQPFMFVVMVT